MMERLTIDEIIEHCERKTKLYEEIGKSVDFETIELTDAIKEYWEHKQVKEYLEELKQYRDLEEQGLLLWLPLKIGDTVYSVTRNYISEYKICSIEKYNEGLFFNWKCEKGMYINIRGFTNYQIGKDVFLTQAEAKQKLKEMEGGNNGTMES